MQAITASIQQKLMTKTVKTKKTKLRPTAYIQPTQKNLATYRFAIIPFDVVSSPFLLTAVIRHPLDEESSKLSAEVEKNLHVDNVVLTAESELESNRKTQEVKDFFKKAKMHLKEFQANYDIEVDSKQEITKKTAKLLEIEWNNIKDEFYLELDDPEKGLQTKRQILQSYGAIYDQLGLLCPIILPWKLLIGSRFIEECVL
uniref:V-type proton ATPase subunit C n=1 Tax=Loa loa TaxID=7209 RepID=A0A1I7VRY2_LOALO